MRDEEENPFRLPSADSRRAWFLALVWALIWAVIGGLWLNPAKTSAVVYPITSYGIVTNGVVVKNVGGWAEKEPGWSLGLTAGAIVGALAGAVGASMRRGVLHWLCLGLLAGALSGALACWVYYLESSFPYYSLSDMVKEGIESGLLCDLFVGVGAALFAWLRQLAD